MNLNRVTNWRNSLDLTTKFESVILGTAIGDAIGLPREGLSRQRAMRIFGGAPLGHRLIFRRGMISDDTEHTCMTAQALLASGGNCDAFARSLAWRLRGWILCLPAGVGLATARACFKLWIGFGVNHSGVWSAGNGPAMRAAIIGVYCFDHIENLKRLVHASSILTHSDPAAEYGALAVALAAAHAVEMGETLHDPCTYIEKVNTHLAGTPMSKLIHNAADAVITGMSLEEYLQKCGLTKGISGYINHTVPAALYCWMRWPRDFRQAVEQVILAGGDADSTGAIVGALVGITAGADAIPKEWINGLLEWPRTIPWMKKLATSLGESRGPVSLFWPGLIVRNIFFLGSVIVHGLRRILPPY